MTRPVPRCDPDIVQRLLHIPEPPGSDPMMHHRDLHDRPLPGDGSQLRLGTALLLASALVSPSMIAGAIWGVSYAAGWGWTAGVMRAVGEPYDEEIVE